MPPTIITSKDKFKRELIREVAQAWIQKSPAQAREIAQMLRETKKAQVHPKTGATKTREAYIKYRWPAELFFVLRSVFRKFKNHGLEEFGQDDRDLHIVHEEFPDLVLSNARR